MSQNLLVGCSEQSLSINLSLTGKKQSNDGPRGLDGEQDKLHELCMRSHRFSYIPIFLFLRHKVAEELL